ncbi:MAG: hypothetical protein ACFE8J_12185 [Candidatus Heimdallarchaeota archaeon]
MKLVNILDSNKYENHLLGSTNIELYETDSENIEINPQFKSLKKWIKTYLGPATAQFHEFNNKKHLAIRDENRNAIIPKFNIEIDGKKFYLSVKGCGAYEDMFFGRELDSLAIKRACRDPSLIRKVEKLSTGLGFIMAESWMGESPYGAQGYINGFDELKFSKLANFDSINGAHICPAIAVVQLSKEIEKVARNFFWFRTYKDHFYQVLRLIPSNVRLYFESNHTISNPTSLFSLFGINDSKKFEEFELNFIKSGIALLSLYLRSAIIDNGEVTGIVYQDVWLDKDCVVAPDGTIHFADIEGLIWKKVPLSKFTEIQKKEWQKLIFEFLYALFQIDSYRHKKNGIQPSWSKQREELALLIQLALDNDVFAYAKNQNNNLIVILEEPSLPILEIPIIEKVKST